MKTLLKNINKDGVEMFKNFTNYIDYDLFFMLIRIKISDWKKEQRKNFNSNVKANNIHSKEFKNLTRRHSRNKNR